MTEGQTPTGRLCRVLSSDPAPVEDYMHLLTGCRATADPREDKLPALLNTVAYYDSNNSILANPSPQNLTQFLLDPSSLNLPTDLRISPDHPGFTDIVKQCSLLINFIHKDRKRQLEAQGFLGKT